MLLGALALPATGLSLALPSEATGDPATSARQAYDLIDEGFGDGRNGPLIALSTPRDASVPAGEAFAEVVSTISSFGDVQNAQVVGVNEAGDTAQILVTPKSGPTDPATMDLVASLRGAEGGLNDSIGVSYGITGQTALEGDVSDTLQDALVPYLAVVVGLAFILLLLGVPLDPGSADRDARLPAQRARDIRCDGGDLPGRLGWASSRTRNRS